MARFKKRRSRPTAGSDDTSKRRESHTERPADGIPDTEGSPSSTPPPTSPPPPRPANIPPPPDDLPVSEAERSEKDRKLNLLFWMRVAIAVIAGAAATFIFADIEGEERRWASIAFMIILFIGTVFVAKGMKMQLPSSDRKKVVTQALGSYVFLYLFTWIVTYTLINLEDVQYGVNL